MGRYADIVTAVKEAVGDATDAQAQRWVLQGARILNSRAKWYVLTGVSIGSTTADQSTYTVTSTVIDLEAVFVDGTAYTPITPSDHDRLVNGDVRVAGGRFFSPYWSSTGAPQIRLWPVPDESGLAITARQVGVIPTPTWASDDPPFPLDFDLALENMAIAIGKARLDEELVDAEWFEARFASEIQALRNRRHSRIGKGGIQIGVKGFHF